MPSNRGSLNTRVGGKLARRVVIVGDGGDTPLTVQLSGSSVPDEQAFPMRRLGQLGEQLYVNDTSALDASEEDTILDLPTTPCIIDHFQWAASIATAQLRIWTPTQAFTELTRTGSSITSIRPDTIVSHGSSLWDVVMYDTTNNYYKFINRAPLIFPLGVKINRKNNDAGNSVTLGVHIYGRKYVA